MAHQCLSISIWYWSEVELIENIFHLMNILIIWFSVTPEFDAVCTFFGYFLLTNQFQSWNSSMEKFLTLMWSSVIQDLLNSGFILLGFTKPWIFTEYSLIYKLWICLTHLGSVKAQTLPSLELSQSRFIKQCNQNQIFRIVNFNRVKRKRVFSSNHFKDVYFKGFDLSSLMDVRLTMLMCQFR